MEKLISVIVPVFNVENYIDECLSSLINQSYSNLEIIVVDDGSTDNSSMLCDKWAALDDRIHVIHQSNRGLSAARNSGIDIASGEYICFVDSDDYVKENYVKCMVNAIEETGADVAICDVDTPRWAEFTTPVTGNRILEARECRAWLNNLISREYVLMVVAWNKLYRKSLFTINRFELNKFHEDEFMVNKLLYSVGKMVFVPSKEYFYRENVSGITGKANENNIAHLDTVEAYNQRIDLALENNDAEFAKVTMRNALYKISDFYYRMPSEKDYIKNIMKHEIAEYGYVMSFKQKLKYKLFLVVPRVFRRIFL